MNKFITAVTDLDVDRVREFLKGTKWMGWAEPSGKNALHYASGVPVADDGERAKSGLEIVKMLLGVGMDIDSVHNIPDDGGIFPATPLWYAYTKGRNEKVYRYLLDRGAKPDNCWWAIAWYDDVAAAELFLSHGATLDKKLLGNMFVMAIYAKKYDFAWWAEKRGADVNTVAPQGVNALMIAVKRKDDELIRKLVSLGANPDVKNETGESARSIADKRGPKRVINALDPAHR